MSKHMMPQRSKEFLNFKKMPINFRKKGYSGIIPFVYVGKTKDT